MNHVVSLLCVALMICILVFCIQSVEGFEDSIPDYCGSAGFVVSKSIRKVNGLAEKDVDRMYSPSECSKIEGATFKNGSCTILKDGKSIICNQTCRGLNTIASTPPDECNIDGKLIGITNKEFTVDDTIRIIMYENTVRLYTDKECESLNGKHNISFLAKMSKSNRDKFTKDHGKGYGLCEGKDNMSYSFICYAEPPSVADVKNKISGLFS